MTHLRHFFSLVLMAWLTFSAAAQTPEELARLDPEEFYFQAWIMAKEAEELEQKEDYVAAFSKYSKARSFFDILKATKPNFRPEGIASNSKSAKRAMEKIHDKALAQQGAEQASSASPLVEIPGEITAPVRVPTTIPSSSLDQAKIQSLQNNIRALTTQLNRRASSRDAESARLRRQIQSLQTQLNQAATAPLRDNVAELNRQIEQLRKERDAMEYARDKAVAQQARTLRRLEITQAALAESNAEKARLEAIIEKQTEINGQVVKGQQEQINALKKTIQEKDALIAEANDAVAELREQLEQSHTMVAELQEERTALIEERDQMKSFLKMSEADRVQELINQMVEKNKEYNQALLDLETVQAEADSKKEVILSAMQRLVVAKAKIENLQKSNTQANLRMEKMEKRLNQAESDLLAQLNGKELNARGKAEIKMLRGVIEKQKLKIAAQQGAAQILLAQGDEMAKIDEAWKKAMGEINGDIKTSLTLQEEQLLERTQTNPSFNNSQRPTVAEFTEARANLQNFTKNTSRTARRLFKKGDLQATRGLLELIAEEDPGSWETMVNLGIVHLRLEDPIAATSALKRAIILAGNRKIPYAHFMNGDALYRQNLYDSAAEQFKLSLTLDPENAKGHVFLGNIAGKTSDLEGAKFHYQEAIVQDPTLYEPYFNLSLIAHVEGRKDEAKKYYTDYLRRNGPADPNHEKAINL